MVSLKYILLLHTYSQNFIFSSDSVEVFFRNNLLTDFNNFLVEKVENSLVGQF